MIGGWLCPMSPFGENHACCRSRDAVLSENNTNELAFTSLDDDQLQRSHNPHGAAGPLGGLNVQAGSQDSAAYEGKMS